MSLISIKLGFTASLAFSLHRMIGQESDIPIYAY